MSHVSSCGVAAGVGRHSFSKEVGRVSDALAPVKENGLIAAVIGKHCNWLVVSTVVTVTIAARTDFMHFVLAGLPAIHNICTILAEFSF